MKVTLTKTKRSTIVTITKSYRNRDGKSTSKVIERLGDLESIKKRTGASDPIAWAKEYAKKLTAQEKKETAPVQLKFSQTKFIEPGRKCCFNVGYLFLQQIYHKLQLPKICKKITKRHEFKYNLDAILSRLIYTQILFPGSKKSSFSQSKKFIEAPKFEQHQIYRALSVLFEENDFIEAQIYKNSITVTPRNNKILYYDCTNFFFEIEQGDLVNENGEKGLRQYGHSKENRPNPIVQMGLFMDGNGIPMAVGITPGNTNEQTTLKPLEKKILKDFGESEFVVCTDAGLSSTENRKFNNRPHRKFVTTQSVKQLKKILKEWALGENDWFLSKKIAGKYKKFGPFTLSQIIEEDNHQNIYYKERWIHEKDLEQRLIVSFSTKYKHYQESIRQGQIERAEKIIRTENKIPKKVNANDPKRFIKQDNCTKNGELADKTILSLDQAQIDKEAQYDGFYAVCTNLEEDVNKVIKINSGRWEIEESFRIMKSEFKARPVHLSLSERIHAHFLICFLALIVYRILEKEVPKYTCANILDTLREMNMAEIRGEGYIPIYQRTELTDELHEKAGFHTDFEFISKKNMKKILKSSKNE
jgi:transposase